MTDMMMDCTVYVLEYKILSYIGQEVFFLNCCQYIFTHRFVPVMTSAVFVCTNMKCSVRFNGAGLGCSVRFNGAGPGYGTSRLSFPILPQVPFDMST